MAKASGWGGGDGSLAFQEPWHLPSTSQGKRGALEDKDSLWAPGATPTHPHSGHTVMDFTLLYLWFGFKKPKFHKQLMRSLYFMTIYDITFLQEVDVLLLLAY